MNMRPFFRRTLWPWMGATALTLAAAACDAGAPTALRKRADLPDYTIAEIIRDDGGELNDMSTAGFRVRIRNQGAADGPGVGVYMYVDGKLVGSAPATSVRSMEAVAVRFTWRATPGHHDIAFVANRPPAGIAPAPEVDLGNNSASVSLDVPYARRAPLRREQTVFRELPPEVVGDSRVQSILAAARESGYALDPSTPMVRTDYADAGTTAYLVALAPLASPARSAPLLVIVTSAEKRGAIFPYLLSAADSATLVLYDRAGGVRIHSEGEVQLLRSAHCGEGVVWPCIATVGAKPFAGLLEHVYQTLARGSIAELVDALSDDGAMVALAAYPVTSDLLVDNPPNVSLLVVDVFRCGYCDGPDLRYWFSWTWLFVAEDDNGPVTYLTDRVWVVPCAGGNHYFAAQDTAGNTAWIDVTVHLPPDDPEVSRNDPACHDQGGGG